MSEKIYKRFDLAFNQLRTAIVLFVTRDDLLSAITLAGAADVIFSELVLRKGEKNFTDLAQKEGDPRSRQEVGREINDVLCINALKHMDPGDDEYVLIDEEGCALGAILKAIANCNILKGEEDKVIIGFKYWVIKNIDLKKYNIDLKADEIWGQVLKE